MLLDVVVDTLTVDDVLLDVFVDVSVLCVVAVLLDVVVAVLSVVAVLMDVVVVVAVLCVDAVVLDVGASPSGQASLLTLISRWISAVFARVDCGFPVNAMSDIPILLSIGSNDVISFVSPEFDKAMTRSCLVIMPRSPWLASPECIKKAGEPVLAKVAAILFPMWPDFPIPVTTMRP